MSRYNRNNNDNLYNFVNSLLDGVNDAVRGVMNAANAELSDLNLNVSMEMEKKKENSYDIRKKAKNIANEKASLASQILKFTFGIICGACTVSLASVGFVFLHALPVSIILLSLCAGFGIAAVSLFTSFSASHKLRKAIKKYLPIIGERPEVSIYYLSNALAEDDVQIKRTVNLLLKKQVFDKQAYYDKNKEILVLDGYRESEVEEKPDGKLFDADKWILTFEKLSREIKNGKVSVRLEILVDYLKKIFAYASDNPEEANKLRTFVNYYLPTTEKLARSYLTIEELDTTGENIDEAKAKLEGSFVTLEAVYKKQLEKLYMNEAMDISGDVDVLEAMAKRDGVI